MSQWYQFWRLQATNLIILEVIIFWSHDLGATSTLVTNLLPWTRWLFCSWWFATRNKFTAQIKRLLENLGKSNILNGQNCGFVQRIASPSLSRDRRIKMHESQLQKAQRQKIEVKLARRRSGNFASNCPMFFLRLCSSHFIKKDASINQWHITPQNDSDASIRIREMSTLTLHSIRGTGSLIAAYRRISLIIATNQSNLAIRWLSRFNLLHRKNTGKACPLLCPIWLHF